MRLRELASDLPFHRELQLASMREHSFFALKERESPQIVAEILQTVRKLGLSGFLRGVGDVRIAHGSHRRIPTGPASRCCRRRLTIYVEADNSGAVHRRVYVDGLDTSRRRVSGRVEAKKRRGVRATRRATCLSSTSTATSTGSDRADGWSASVAANVEVIWLLGGLRPDFKTIADFRRDNRAAFRDVFRQFVLLCRRLDLYGRELLAVDGTRIKAVNNKDRNFTRSSLRAFIHAADERLEDYLKRLDEGDVADGATSGGARTKNLAEKIRSAQRETRPLPSDAGSARANRRGPDLR